MTGSDAAATKSPLVVASVGTYSGPIGSILIPMLGGAQTWVASANARGGVNGHAVKLVVYDDGGDPARHRAQTQEAVTRQGAVAFLQNGDLLAGESSLQFLKDKGVPVIGITGGERWAYDSPVYFPQASSAAALWPAYPPSVAAQVVPQGKTRVGTLVCVEIQACDDAERTWKTGAKGVGMELVYQAKVSITQPDFTAECLNAANAGVQVLFIPLDPNTVGRVTGSCARQGFRPTYAVTGQSIGASSEKDPNLDGLVATHPVKPWFVTGTPAMDEFHQATVKYNPRLAPYVAMWGWVSGKMLERAGSNLPEPPTSASILEGLWSLRGDTLNGLTQPLSFERGQPPPKVTCWYNLLLVKGKWTTPDDGQQHCL